MLFRPLVNYYGMSNTFLPIYNILWNSTSALISALGTGHTFRLLFRMNRFLANSSAIESSHGDNLVRILLTRLNPTGNVNTNRIITDNLINNLFPHLPSIIANRHITVKILYFIMSTVSFLFVRPLVNIVLRSLFSLFFSATCILWSESLRGFKALFSYALTVRDLFSPYISIPIPEVVRQNLPGYTTTKILLTGIIIFSTLIGIDLLTPINFESYPIIGWLFYGTYSYLLIPLISNLRTIYDLSEPLRNLFNRYIGFDAILNLFRINRG